MVRGVQQQVGKTSVVELVRGPSGPEVLDEVVAEIINRLRVWCIDRLPDGGRKIDEQFPEVIGTRHQIVELYFLRVDRGVDRNLLASSGKGDRIVFDAMLFGQRREVMHNLASWFSPITQAKEYVIGDEDVSALHG